MKNFNKNIVAVLLMATALTGCGNSAGISEYSSEIPKEIPTKQSSEAEDNNVAEITETITSTSAETTTVATTIPIEDRKPKVNNFTMSYFDDGLERVFDYCFIPKEATELSDDVNLGLINVDGKEFDITNLANAYGDEEIRNIFNEQAGLYTTGQLIKDGVFDDVYIAFKGSPYDDKFIFGENKGVEEIEVNQEKYGLAKLKGAYDFITVEYVNGWFRGLHSKCVAMHSNSTVEQITVNGEEKTFVEGGAGNQFTENSDKLITYTDKNVAIGDGITYGDLVAMFGAEPIWVDSDAGAGHILTYRNSTVTVGFVREYPKNSLTPDIRNKDFADLSQEEINSLRIVAVYQWLNE